MIYAGGILAHLLYEPAHTAHKERCMAEQVASNAGESPDHPRTIALGLFLAFLGFIALGFVYSRRPPANALDALGMLFGGRDKFIQHGWYEFLLLVSAITAFGGLVHAARSYSRIRRASGAVPIF
jgi:hypothetical protein